MGDYSLQAWKEQYKMKKLKIALTSSYSTPCPPPSYGGESYYFGIAKTLGLMGHEVHLFAPGGSEVPPNGHLHLIRATASGELNPSIEEWMEKIYHDYFMEADIIHSCSLDHRESERLRNYYGKCNIINTINGSCYWLPRPPFNVVTGSKAWQEDAKKFGLNTEMVYWGIDTDFYTPEGEKEDYWLWIARFHPDKGLDVALDLAEVMNFKLKVAGSLAFHDHAIYGQRYIERIMSLPMVEYVELPMDSTHHHAKRELYRKAKGFIYPVRYFECFGMVVVEAQACGTPVVALTNGAMPELIEHGKSGFLCNNKTELADSIKRINEIDQSDCVKNASKFSWKNATNEYLKLYERILNGETWR